MICEIFGSTSESEPMNKTTRNALLIAVGGAAIVYVARPLLKPVQRMVRDAVKGNKA